MSEETAKKILTRLDALLSIIISPVREKSTDQEKIQRLDSFDFSPAEIAMILGSTSDKISKQLYVIRSKNKQRK